MQYPSEIVAIVCFGVFGGMAFIALCIKAGFMMRSGSVLTSRKETAHTLPKSVQKAMVALSGVTENRGHRSERQESDESECISEKSSVVDVEAGLGGVRNSVCSVSTTSTTSTSSTTSTCLKGEDGQARPWQPQPIDDEVLKMKRCRHMFHGRCLAAWWLQRRYDCPVCRVPYYNLPVVEPEPSREDLYYQPPAVPIMPFW